MAVKIKKKVDQQAQVSNQAQQTEQTEFSLQGFSYYNFKNILTPNSINLIKDSKIIEQRIEELKQYWKDANKQLKQIKFVPGIPLVSDKDIDSMFSELKSSLKNIKTEQDRKNFFKQYFAVARVAQSYIEAANEFRELKNLGLDAIAFYHGIETDEQMSISSRLLTASMIAIGIGPLKQIRNIKKLKKIEEFIKTENISPKAVANLSELIKKVAAWEKKLRDKVMKERKFLATLSRKAALESFIGFKSIEGVKATFSNPKFIKEMGALPNDKARALLILDNIFDPTSFKILKTDSENIKRTKVFTEHLFNTLKKGIESSDEINNFIINYVKSGGTIEEAKTILFAFEKRIHLAGNTIGNAFVKNLESELLHTCMHGFKNLLTHTSLYNQLFIRNFEELSKANKLLK